MARILTASRPEAAARSISPPILACHHAIPLIWVAFITVPYARAAIETLGNSGFPRASQAIPTLAVVAGLAALGLVIGSLRFRWLHRWYVYGLAIVAGAMLL